MNKTEIKDKIEEMKIEIEKLECELISKDNIFKPEIDDEYWYINTQGDIYESTWDDEDADDERFEFGNIFATEELASREYFETKLIRKLKRFALEHNGGELDWTDFSIRKYSIFYSNNYSSFDVDFTMGCREFGQVYFATQEIAERALEEFKEDLLKYFTTNN